MQGTNIYSIVTIFAGVVKLYHFEDEKIRNEFMTKLLKKYKYLMVYPFDKPSNTDSIDEVLHEIESTIIK